MKKKITRRSNSGFELLLSKFLVQNLSVLFDPFLKHIQLRKMQTYLFPQRVNNLAHKPNLIIVKGSQVLVLEAFCHFNLANSFQLGLLIKFV